MSRKRNYRQIIQDRGIGIVADLCGCHYETIRAIVYDGSNPSARILLHLIKKVRGINIDDFLEDEKLMGPRKKTKVDRPVYDPDTAKG
jgi:hypothetical protein